MPNTISAEYSTLYLLKKLKYQAELACHSSSSELSRRLLASITQKHDEERARLHAIANSKQNIVHLNFALAAN